MNSPPSSTGTLMHPKILQRVIGNDGSHLKICPAVLLEYTRHHVKYAEYPGIVPYSRGKDLFDRPLDPEEKSVRGSLVVGLSKQDIRLLDYFEGSEYTREKVAVHPLATLITLADYTLPSTATQATEDLLPSTPAPLPALSELPAAVDTETYVYRDLTYLERDLWSFDDFVATNASKWYGKAADSNEDVIGVDSVREALTSQT